MEALKTYQNKKSFPEEKIVKEKIDLLSLKGSEVKTREERYRGFIPRIPNMDIECICVDSHEDGKHHAILNMLSKAPEMLELLMKTVGKLQENIELQRSWGLHAVQDEAHMKEIKKLLKQIID